MILRSFLITLFFTLFANGELIKHSLDVNVTGRPIMFIFTSATCPYCEQLKKDLDEVKFLHKVATDFDIYEIRRDKPEVYTIFGEKTPLQELQMMFRVKVTPYVVVFNSKGAKMWQIPGYSDPYFLAKVLKFVKGVDDGKYKKEEWKKYLIENKLIKTKPTQH